MGLNDSQIRDALRDVLDPELGINIVDLGLLRGVAAGQDGVRITLVMTSPACPLGDALIRDVTDALQRRGIAGPVRVEIAREPPWSPESMSAEAKRQLGWPKSR